MLARFEKHLHEMGWSNRSERLLVGYSGGADSTCLLHLLHESGYDVVAAHLHHGQRQEAEDEAERCAAFCEELGVSFARGDADVPKIARDFKIGLEEAGRQARYNFFERAASRLECTWIATAHTRDDLVETQVLNLVRGTGLAGLAGIPARRGRIIRPLLPFTRQETREFCTKQGLWFHDDPANSNLRFARSRIRQKVMPELRKVNANFLDNAARLAVIASEEDQFLDSVAAASLERCEAPLNGPLRFLALDCEVAFRLSELTSLPSVVRNRGMRLAVETLGATLDFNQTQSLADGMMQLERGSVTAEGGTVVVEWHSDLVHVRSITTEEAFSHPLTVPGITESPEFGWQLGIMAASELELGPHDPLVQTIDHVACQGPLIFRSVEPGDVLSPLGMAGTKKLGVWLGEAGLTLAARSRLPIICDGAGPIVVPGVGIADRVRVEKGSSTMLRIEFGPLESV